MIYAILFWNIDRNYVTSFYFKSNHATFQYHFLFDCYPMVTISTYLARTHCLAADQANRYCASATIRTLHDNYRQDTLSIRRNLEALKV